MFNKTLLGTIKAPVQALHQERLGLIDEADYSGVRRKVREELEKQNIIVTDDFLDEGVLSLKQYYAVALLDPNNEHAVSDVIDPFWHAHILHTKEYAGFCDRVFGHFVHHTPLNHEDLPAVKHVAKLYAHTSKVYKELFNYVNASFYPDAMPEVRLICMHNKVSDEKIREIGLYPEDMALAA